MKKPEPISVTGKCFNVLKCFLLLASILVSPQLKANPVTINMKNVTLEKALVELQRQTDFDLIYKSTDVARYGNVTINFTNLDVEQAVARCLAGTNLIFEKQRNSIVISQKPSDGRQIPARVTGVVTDEEGKPVIGATVQIVGTTVGVVTDQNGFYQINVPTPQTSSLRYSYTGKTSREEKIAGRMRIDVQMKADNKVNDVIVIGYGTAQAKDFTGSVSSIKPDVVKPSNVMTLDDMISGKASGVSVIKSDGSPGGAVRMRVRGGASLLGANDPLYVIDGVPTEVKNSYIGANEITNPVESANYGESFDNSISGAFTRGLNSIAGLNINDIESIDILKDASATAIYGSKAANGVVIITTKRGARNQKTAVNINYYFGLSNPKKEEVLNASEYKTMLKEAAGNYIERVTANGFADPGAKAYITAKLILEDPAFFGTADTDWVDLVLRTGYTNNVDASVSGGGENSRFYNSLSYTNQTGTIIGTDFTRLSGKVSLDNDLRKWARLSTNINFGYTKNNITSGAYEHALTAPPVFPVYNADGTYGAFGELSRDYRGYQNPLAVADVTNMAKTYMLLGTVALELDIFKELKFRSTVSVEYNNYNQLNYIPSYVDISDYMGHAANPGGTGSQGQSLGLNTFFENTFTYDKTFNEKHRLNALLGTSWEDQRTDYFYASGTGYPDDYFLNNLSAAITAAKVEGAAPDSRSSLLSFYLRANYTFMDRYLFTFTGRSDASSKFGPSNRVGYFPSGAIAWRISEEGFMDGAKWVDELKLRVSAGKTGTQSIGDHMWRTLYAPGSYAGQSALYPSQLGNDAIHWEPTVQKDLGIDFSLFGYRLNGTVAYYDKTTYGALLNTTTAPSSSYQTVVRNIADIRNRGLEFEFRADFIRGKNFTWSGNFNIAGNRSKVLNIDGGPFSDPNDRENINLGTSIVQEGEPLGLFYGRVVDGVFRTQEEVDAYKTAMGFRYEDGYYTTIGIGSYKYRLDPDGATVQDIIGYAAPDFFGGYTNTFKYKNWSLQALLTFSHGGSLMYQKDVTDQSMNSLQNRGRRLLTAERPANVWFEDQYLTNKNIYDASYLKLKSLSLSYVFPDRMTSKIGITGLVVYATASNLFTITGYPGPDPEVSDDPVSIIGGGRDVSTYPTSREFSFGLRMNF